MKSLLIATSFLFLFSCQGSHQAPENSLNDAHSIIGGETVSLDSDFSHAIVGIYDSEYQFICTGSLISPNHVLTAAHCIGDHPTKMMIIFAVDMDTVIGNKHNGFGMLNARRVTDAKIHPTYKPEEQEEKEDDYGDIAVIKFAGSVPTGYHEAQLLSDSTLVQSGVDVTVAGYGVSEVETHPIDPATVEDLQDAIEWGEIFCKGENNTDCVTVEMSGDGVLRQTHALISTLQATEFHLDESKGHGTCNGDSGGPAYIQVENKFYLTGITSRGSALCDDVGVYTNVIPYLGWINETMPLMK